MACGVLACQDEVHAQCTLRDPCSMTGFLNDLTYFILLIALLAVRNKRANIVLLLLMLARYAVFPLLFFLKIGVHGRLF